MSLIVISAGGTGGHLFPAQALAQELVRRGHQILVMTDARFANYATAFPGAKIVTVPSSPFNAISAPFKIAAGVLMAFVKLVRLQPAAVIGFGGYPSVPVMLAAWAAGRPTAILEQNAVVGRANRLVMNKMKAVAAAFPLARFAPRDASKIVLTGNPLRPEVTALWGDPYSMPRADGAIRILVFGGSQGARVMADIVPGAIEKLEPSLWGRLLLTQQVREEDMVRVRAVYDRLKINAELAPFFADLPARLAANHLVISRSGAGTVSELAAIGRPSILVPLPGSIDQDQFANAGVLSQAGGALRIPQAEFTPDRLASEISALAAEPSKLAVMAQAAKSTGRLDAAARLADLVVKVAGI